ncbi:MAG: MFS transporter [Thaumarchaeota archaeon]|nr:MFS transporter [Nitrososphaerota archaeon]
MGTKDIVPRGNILTLVLATSISSASNVALSFLPVYFTSLGGTVLQYGMVTTFATLIGIPSAISGAGISQMASLKRIAILTSLIGPAVLLGYYFSNSWTTLSIPILIGATGAVGSTTWRLLVADTTTHKGRTAQLSLYQTLTAVPTILSPLAGGFLVNSMGTIDGFRAGVLLSLAMAPISTLLLARFLRESPRQQFTSQTMVEMATKNSPIVKATRHAKFPLPAFRGFPRILLPLISAYALVIVANSMTGPYLIFYATGIAKLDSFQWGAILSLQMVFANIIRTPLGIISDRFDKGKVLFTSVLATAPLSMLLILVHSFFGVLGIILAMAATGISYGPTHEAFQIELTQREQRPALFATHETVRNIATSAGTVTGGLLFTANYALTFYGFTVLEAVAAVIIGWAFIRNSKRPRMITQ